MKTAMVVFSHYPSDPRVRREAEALADEGGEVHVICLRGEGESPVESFRNIIVHRLDIQRKRGRKLSYISEYVRFILMSSVKLAALHIKYRYRLVHVHNMPDILVFTALVPKLTGSKIILDLHDPMPEVYMAKYGMKREDYFIRFLKYLEKKSISFADRILTPNIAFKNLFLNRGCPEAKIQIVMNSPQESIFDSQYSSTGKKKEGQHFVLMYHGTIVERHGLGVALDAIKQLQKAIPNIRFHVFGDGDSYYQKFMERINELGLQKIVQVHGRVSLEKIASAIEEVDIGIIPNNKNVFTDLNFPTRIFEYLSKGKPVVVPRTRGIQDYFKENEIFYFDPGNPENLAKTILNIYSNRSYRDQVQMNSQEIYYSCQWKNQKKVYIDLVKQLVGPTHLETQ
ncbi:MAG TPA: glycosyltransferase family 4 protein [Candidatus Deferrimicrobiaceae bacterium]|jgi:glycosyltransferase involved in cell wall biosynthesis